MAKKKSKRQIKSKATATSYGEAVGFKNYIFNNETTDFLLGLVLLVVAVYMIIAMVSYFSTGQADQSILENLRPGEWTNSGREFQNYCGSLGALLSYFLITVCFGLSAFFIPAFIILVALQLMRAYKINLWKWFLGMAVVMIWSSVTLAKFLTPFMGDQVFNPGGKHGLFCVQQLENVVGAPGLTGILFIVALAFLTYLTRETIQVVRKALNPIGYLTSKVAFSITNHHKEEQRDINEEYEQAE